MKRKKNWMKKILSTVMVMALFCGLLTGCGEKENSDNETAKEMKTVKFGLLPYQDWMPWMLADELGYFKEAGIDLEVITFTDDITCAEAFSCNYFLLFSSLLSCFSAIFSDI